MSVLFHAPLFGIFEVEENSEEDLAESLPTVQKCLMHLMRFMSTSCAVSVL